MMGDALFLIPFFHRFHRKIQRICSGILQFSFDKEEHLSLRKNALSIIRNIPPSVQGGQNKEGLKRLSEFHLKKFEIKNDSGGLLNMLHKYYQN